MHRLAMILTAAFAFAAADPSPVGAQSPGTGYRPIEKALDQYKDKNRVLLVFAPSAKDAAYVEQTKLWKNEKAGFDERQLMVWPVLNDQEGKDAAAPGGWQKKYGVEPKAFAVVLIGKDGHDAYRADKPLKPETLYGVIDAMPMRKAEMKRAKTAKEDKGHRE